MTKLHDNPRRTDQTRLHAHNINAPATDDFTVVETHGLSKRFGRGVLAVDGVNMSVRRGEVSPPITVLLTSE